MLILMPFFAAWRVAVTHTYLFYLSELALQSSGIQFWTTKGYYLVECASGIITGVWISSHSTKRYLIAVSTVCAIVALVQGVFANYPMAVVAEFTMCFWDEAAIACSLSYVCRATPQATRTSFIIVYYLISNEFVFHVYAGLSQSLAQVLFTPHLMGWACFAMCLVSILVLLPLPEVTDEENSSSSTIAERASACRSVVSGAATIIVLFLLIAAYLTHNVYYSVLINVLLAPQGELTLQDRQAIVFGVLGFYVLYFAAACIVARYVDDRKLLAVQAILLVLGYGLVISWTTFSVVRFVLGSVALATSLSIILAIATALLTKLVPHAYVNLWISMVAALERLMGFVGSYWASAFTTQTSSNLPYETTLALIGVAMLLMIPVYRRMLPQVFSPWSGHALPRKPSFHTSAPIAVPGSPGSPFGMGSGSLNSQLLHSRQSASTSASGDSAAMDGYVAPAAVPMRSLPPKAEAVAYTVYDELD
eukprot:TRINITY_DN8283_c0_g1_i1.p1 TRINITY_DN8283_c0_g1~~TRINITY_DN8283_c0_g1_i1.p1  ORF type:complete len:478 (+),score=64.95 TRINITY_DN8283_c0_g1_i1:97-1530(+)